MKSDTGFHMFWLLCENVALSEVERAANVFQEFIHIDRLPANFGDRLNYDHYAGRNNRRYTGR